MTARQRRWTGADQARLEAALRLDAGANIAFARLAASTRPRTCWLRAPGLSPRQEDARPKTRD
jgi:hypothetical protein